MNFLQLQTAVQTRGVQYLADTAADLTRLKDTINRANTEIVDSEDWPFMAKSAIGTLPITIADLRKVESVYTDTPTVSLDPLGEREMHNLAGSLADTGSPTHYYTRTSGGTQLLWAYPAGTTVTWTVRYYAFAATLTADVDTPEIPTRYHPLIVDLAVYYLAEDSQTKNFAKADFDNGIGLMRVALTDRLLIDQQRITFASEDW